jgi:hypothetical protein
MFPKIACHVNMCGKALTESYPDNHFVGHWLNYKPDLGTKNTCVPVCVSMKFFDVTSVGGYRLRPLLQEIGSKKENKTIIFVETKGRVDEITGNICHDGFVVHSMIICHSNIIL